MDEIFSPRTSQPTTRTAHLSVIPKADASDTEQAVETVYGGNDGRLVARVSSCAYSLWPERDATDLSVLRHIYQPFGGPVVELDLIDIVLGRSDAGK
jgi:hypothetical protein